MRSIFGAQKILIFTLCGFSLSALAQSEIISHDISFEENKLEKNVEVSPQGDFTQFGKQISTQTTRGNSDQNLQIAPTERRQQPSFEQNTTAPVQSGAGIIVLNQGQASQPIQQPTTYVEANPTIESRAEQYRRARQDAEMNTEKKIFEKLEESRLADEKSRLEKILGPSINSNSNPPNPYQNYSSPAPSNTNGFIPGQQPSVQVIAPSNSMLPTTPLDPTKDSVKKPSPSQLSEDEIELEVAVADKLSQKAEQFDKPQAQYYASGAVGSVNYLGVENVQGNISAGASVGKLMPNGVSVEVSFAYSNFYIDEYWWNYRFFKEMDQYNLGVAAKYTLDFGLIRPSFGGIASYVYRKYSDREYYSYSNSDASEVTSHAIDLGLSLGLDISMSEGFAVGVEYRYMTNLANRADSDYLTSRSLWREGQPVEKTDYDSITLTGKFRF